MRKLRTTLMGISAFAALTAGAMAADFSAMPADYESTAEDYIMTRLVDARSARVQFVSDPYPVIADFNGYSNVEAWAVDLRIRSRLENGKLGGYVPYTLLFVDGEPVAFSEDAQSMAKIDTPLVYASSD